MEQKITRYLNEIQRVCHRHSSGVLSHCYSLEVSQATLDQRQVHQLFVLVVQLHCELWFLQLRTQEEVRQMATLMM